MRFSRSSRIASLVSILLLSCSTAIASSDLESGQQLVGEKNYEKALPFLDKSVDAEPTNGNCHYWRAKCLAGMDKVKESCAEYKLAAMLLSDPQLRLECYNELAKQNIELPKGSANDLSAEEKAWAKKEKAAESNNSQVDSPEEGANGEKLFKLSSKKLDWNLDVRSDFLQAMKARTDNLDALASGSQWRIASGARRNRPNPIDLRTVVQGSPAHSIIPLSAGERKAISQCDIVLILDHSGSMMTPDCPSLTKGVEARISWCAAEIEKFADDLSSAFPHGFYFITFDSIPTVFAIDNAAQLRSTLQSLKAGGGTNLSAALNEAFRLHMAHPQQPMLIAVITDAEIDVQSSEKAIVDATRQFPLPNGVFISILQIGIMAEANTADRLNYLDGLKTRAGAAYDAVVGIPFSKVRQDGLGRDLLSGLRANAYAYLQAMSKPGTSPAKKIPESRLPAAPKANNSSEQKKPDLPAVSKPPEKTSREEAPKKSPDVPVMWPVK